MVGVDKAQADSSLFMCTALMVQLMHQNAAMDLASRFPKAQLAH